MDSKEYVLKLTPYEVKNLIRIVSYGRAATSRYEEGTGLANDIRLLADAVTKVLKEQP